MEGIYRPKWPSINIFILHFVLVLFHIMFCCLQPSYMLILSNKIFFIFYYECVRFVVLEYLMCYASEIL